MDGWYFAYGSNLDVGQKRRRTGPVREARRARLPGYRLAFNKRGMDGSAKANIEPAAANVVWGVVYKCSRAAFEAMDRHEGVAAGHYRRTRVRVQVDSGEELDADTYIAETAWVFDGLAPSREYLDRIIGGAKEHALPDDYIAALETTARRGS